MTTTASPATNAFRLNAGDTFPTFEAPRVGGGTLTLPDELAGSWGVVLFTRGAWCSYCRTQLTDFQRHLTQLTEAGAKVISLSVDPEDAATENVASLGVTFPVAYGFDPEQAARTVGTYLSNGNDGHPTYTQATGFILTPTGQVAVAVYSSSAIGRLTAADTLGLITYAQKRG